MTGTAKPSYLHPTTISPAAAATTAFISNPTDLVGHAHLTGHVAVSAKSHDEAMDVVVAKIISLLVLTVLSVLCGLLPLRLLIHTPHIFSKNRKPVESFLCGLRLFSGGIYLATCFLHLLPDTREKMAAVMVNMGSRSTYAIPELLVISGFYAVVFVEQIIKTLYFRAENSGPARKKKRPKRRKIREVYTSTLDESDTHRPVDRFEMTDDYSRNSRNLYDDDSDMKGDDDDDDDENNVLVDDEEYDDDFMAESDMESDGSSQDSYTCVKKSIDAKEDDVKCFQQEALQRPERVYQNHTKSDAYPDTKELDKKSRDHPITCGNVSVHMTTASMTSSPAIIASTITSNANKTVTSPASSSSCISSPSSSLPFTEAFTPITFCASKTAPRSPSDSPKLNVSNAHLSACYTKTQSTPAPLVAPSSPVLKTTSTHIFPFVCHDSGSANDITDTCKHNPSIPSAINVAKIRTRLHQSGENAVNVSLVQNHQPYSKEEIDNDITTRSSCLSKPIYPICTESTPHKGPVPISPGPAQYPKFTEPTIQYLCDDKIRIHENHIEHENIVPPSDFADRDNGKSNSNSSRDKDNDSGIFSSKRESDEKFVEERRRLMGTSSENSIDRISECACSMQEFQVQHAVDELKHVEESTSAHLRSIIYIMALAFHGIFEGMALGLQSVKNSVWALCFAIVVHRCVLAFKLGMDLCRGEEKQGTSFLCIGTFTLISALGIIIGILISSGASFYSDVSVPEAILQSLATGTIIYIVFLDILIKDLQGRDDLKRVSCTFVGFSLMAVVFAVASS